MQDTRGLSLEASYDPLDLSQFCNARNVSQLIFFPPTSLQGRVSNIAILSRCG